LGEQKCATKGTLFLSLDSGAKENEKVSEKPKKLPCCSFWAVWQYFFFPLASPFPQLVPKADFDTHLLTPSHVFCFVGKKHKRSKKTQSSLCHSCQAKEKKDARI